MLSCRIATLSLKVYLRDCGYKPAKDLQKLRDSVEVLSFIDEPEDHIQHADTYRVKQLFLV